MYNFGVPYYYCSDYNNNSNSWWIWVIIIVFVIFCLCGSDRGRNNCR